MKLNKNKLGGFTLIEVLVAILLFSMIIMVGFQALASIGVGKVKLIQKTDIEKQAFFASEKFFELIKKGGTIDYEEYFNRKIVSDIDIDKTGDFNNGHYSTPTGFGNFGPNGIVGTDTYGDGFYYCRSGNLNTYGDQNGDGILFDPLGDVDFKSGCVSRNNYNGNPLHIGTQNNDFSSEPQRYGQYSFQFMDYNGDKNPDNGDINGDGNPLLDDDDEPLGSGPSVFDIGDNLTELYLVNLESKERTLFRWHFVQDPDDTKYTCNPKTGGDGCLGNIEFLRLEGKDFGFDHTNNPSAPSFGLNDGVIDTWVISEEFEGEAGDVIAGSNNNNYWQPIFPNTMNVKDVKFILYPNKDNTLAWKDSYDSVSSISPFVKIYMTLTPSASRRRGIQGKIPEIKIATTINLGSLTK